MRTRGAARLRRPCGKRSLQKHSSYQERFAAGSPAACPAGSGNALYCAASDLGRSIMIERP